MPRLLYWNVEHFSDDKFFRRSRKRARDDDQGWGANRGDELRTNYLLPAITAHDPSFIVILEVRPGNAALLPGQLVDDVGAVNLLRSIRLTTGNQWSLVPPLMLGLRNRGEGIAVYYRRDRYFFTGPWRYPGGAGRAGRPATVPAPGYYPAPWRRLGPAAAQSALPSRIIPGGLNPNNAGQQENRLAGQWRFPGTAHNVHGFLRFPGPSRAFRRPFLTTFWDPVNAQTVKIMAFHAPPDQLVGGFVNDAQSVKGTRRLSFIFDIQAIAGNEIQMIVGDFNISIFNALAVARAYGPLGAMGFARLINATPNQFPDKGYVATHIATRAIAAPWWTNGYPGFEYQSVPDLFGAYDSIDNAFVRYGAGIVPPGANNTTIVNMVAGSPYTAIAAPFGCPTGHHIYLTAMNDEPNTLNSPVGINPLAGNAWDVLEDFLDVDNYGTIRETSDHLPLIFDY